MNNKNRPDPVTGPERTVTDEEQGYVRREAALLKILEWARIHADHSGSVMPWNGLTETIREISGARFAACNRYDAPDRPALTVALSGPPEHLIMAENLLGFSVTGHGWDPDPRKAGAVGNRGIVRFGSLGELAGEVIDREATGRLQELAGLGAAYVVPIRREDRILGDFTLFMDKDMELKDPDLVELFASQSGLLLERIQAEQKLQEERRLYQAALDASGTGVWILDPAIGDITYSSRRWHEMLGYSEGQVPDTREEWEKLVHPEDWGGALEDDRLEQVHRLRQADGSWKWILTRANLLRDDEGRPLFLVGTNMDLTEIRDTQDQLAAQGVRLAHLLESTGAGTWEWDIGSGRMVIDDRWAEIIGYRLEDLEPVDLSTWSSRLHPEDRQRVLDALEVACGSTGEHYRTQYRLRHKEGHWVWILDQGKVVSRTEDGRACLMYGTHLDITEQKNMELRLRETGEEMKTLVDSSYGIIYRVTTEGLFTFVSRAWNRLLGHSVEEALGRSFHPFVHPEDLPLLTGFFERIAVTRRREELEEYRLRHRDGSWHWFTTNAVPIWNERGEVTGFAGTARDITELKKAHMDLLEQKEELDRYFAVSLDLLVITGRDGTLLRLNPAWERVLGFSAEVLQGKNYLDLVHPEDISETLAAMARMDQGQEISGFVNRYRCTDGSYRYLEWKSFMLEDRIYGSARDVTGSRQMAESLHMEKELFRTTLLSVGDGVLSVDRQGRILLMNPQAGLLVGVRPEQAGGMPLEDAFRASDRETGKPCTLDSIRRSGRERKGEAYLAAGDGTRRAIDYTAAPVRDSRGEVTGDVIVFRDVTERLEKLREVEYLSYHNHLTGLYNRRYLEETLLRLDTPENLPLTVMVCDVNGLKLTNDAFGHKAGDLLLQTVARFLTGLCRPEDVLCRAGGDEFVLLLPATGRVEAQEVRRRILEEASEVSPAPLIVSLAVGYETKSREGRDIQDVFLAADNRMYRNKLHNGRRMRSLTIETVLRQINDKYGEEQIHTERVSRYCGAIARAMGLEESAVEQAVAAGACHDIGKITVRAEILNKTTPLTPEDWEELRRHPVTGYHILKGVDEYMPLADAVLFHHERMDGKGYPEGLSGQEIPLLSRIIAVADAYEAMTARRSYRESLGHDRAAEELKRCAGTQFDPEVVRVFLEMVLNGPDTNLP